MYTHAHSQTTASKINIPNKHTHLYMCVHPSIRKYVTYNKHTRTWPRPIQTISGVFTGVILGVVATTTADIFTSKGDRDQLWWQVGARTRLMSWWCSRFSISFQAHLPTCCVCYSCNWRCDQVVCVATLFYGLAWLLTYSIPAWRNTYSKINKN